SGTLTLNNTSAGAGAYSVSGTGTLNLGAVTGSGDISVGAGGTLNARGANSGAGALTIASGGLATIGDGTTNGTLSTGAVTNNATYGAKLFFIAGAGAGGAGAILNTGPQQQNVIQKLALTANATIAAVGAAGQVTGRFDIRGGTPTLDLAGHTLTKIGDAQFTL